MIVQNHDKQNLIRPILIAAAVAAALFTRRFRFIGVLARVGFRVFAISVDTSAPKPSFPFALARAAREVDHVHDKADANHARPTR